MRKRIAKTFVAAALITSIAGTSVWADDVTDLECGREPVKPDTVRACLSACADGRT